MGELRIFPRHESADDVYLVGGAWAPACITAVEKRFTDAELAAEYWRHNGDTDAVHEGIRVGTFGGLTANGLLAEDLMKRRLDTLARFATLPHHDQEES